MSIERYDLIKTAHNARDLNCVDVEITTDDFYTPEIVDWLESESLIHRDDCYDFLICLLCFSDDDEKDIPKKVKEFIDYYKKNYDYLRFN